MSDEVFKVPKNPARVEILVPPEEPVERVVYLSELAEHHRGPETVADLLAASGRFLPVVSAKGAFTLVSKRSIRWVRVLEPDRAEWLYFEERGSAPRIEAWFEFEGNGRLEGGIYAVTPEGLQRVQDVVNLERAFLHLESNGDLYLVNLGQVRAIGLLGG
jgi:hypothetical protein